MQIGINYFLWDSSTLIFLSQIPFLSEKVDYTTHSKELNYIYPMQ